MEPSIMSQLGGLAIVIAATLAIYVAVLEWERFAARRDAGMTLAQARAATRTGLAGYVRRGPNACLYLVAHPSRRQVNA